MESKKLEIIKDLMKQLEDQMASSAEDFSERLGRKPKIEAKVIEIEAKPKEEMPEEEMPEEEMVEEEMVEDEEMSMPEEMDEKEDLKERLLRLRNK